MSAHDAPLLAAAFCFLRHGETENNRLGLIAGMTDVPLNATGVEQACTAAQRLGDAGIDAIWSSPLMRARMTAHHVAETLGLPVVVVPQLAERNWGELEGTPRDQRIPGNTPPGGESLEVFRARTLAGFAQIRGSCRPLIVAHSGTFRILCDWLCIAQRSAPLANCMPLLFSPEAGGWRITAL